MTMLVCAVLLAGTTSAMTVEQWTTFDRPYQQVYALGVPDARMNLEQTHVEGAKTAGVPAVKVQPSVITRIVNCIAKRYSFTQMGTIVGNYVAQHLHEQKQVGMASAVWAAMNGACNTPEPKGK